MICSEEFVNLSLIAAHDNNLTAVTLTAVTLAVILIIFEIFTQKIDSKFDSTKARPKPDWRARSARPVLLMRAFVESNLESIFA